MGKAPEVLGEFLSPSSEGADQHGKPERYANLGVREYFLFDPDGRYRAPRIQGWSLRRDGSRQTLVRRGDGSIQSRILPVRFMLTEDHVGVVNARTGQLALRYKEVQQLLRQETEARYRAEQAQQRAEQAQRQAERAQRQEAEARQRAEQVQRQEAAARTAAGVEAARLRAELERLRRLDDGDGQGVSVAAPRHRPGWESPYPMRRRNPICSCCAASGLRG